MGFSNGWVLFLLATTAFPVAAQEPAPPPVDAEITIRKDPPSVTRKAQTGPYRRSGGSASRASAPAVGPAPAEAAPPAPPAGSATVGRAVEALGETWSATGTLHLPGVGGRGAKLDAVATPFVDLEAGGRVIIDVGGRIPAAQAGEIGRRWPGNRVLSFPAGAGPREILGGLLAASGYATVGRGTPLTFGREVRVRLQPDFVVLRRDSDLLEGRTRALSVVDSPLDLLPEELRELAAGHRIEVVDLPRDGTAPALGWRDPSGRVTTVEAADAGLVFSEIAEAIGVPAAGGPGAGADLRVEVGEFIAGSGVEAIGPTVDFTRPTVGGGPSRFTVSVPGWLVSREGRRVLVTGASLAAPLRLLLTREGIDVLEYRLRR